MFAHAQGGPVSCPRERHPRAHALPLETVIRVAHSTGTPVIVDAAAELPPRRNLTRYTRAGADLVIFSGGKYIAGPNNSGILAG